MQANRQSYMQQYIGQLSYSPFLWKWRRTYQFYQ